MKTTSITVRFNNGEIPEGIEALKAFCQQVINEQPKGQLTALSENSAIADAMLKTWTGNVEVKHEPK